MMENLVNTVKAFVVAASPALKDAFVKAAKVAAYIVLSAAIAAAGAYLTGQTQLDPMVVAAINIFLAAAKKAVDTLNQ